MADGGEDVEEILVVAQGAEPVERCGVEAEDLTEVQGQIEGAGEGFRGAEGIGEITERGEQLEEIAEGGEGRERGGGGSRFHWGLGVGDLRFQI